MERNIVFTQCDSFSIPIRLSSVKKLVQAEILHLSQETGCPVDTLPIRFLT